MADVPPRSRNALATQVWRRLFDFVMSSASERNRALTEFGMTSNDARALFALGATGNQGRTMRSLAEDWDCDASYATSVIDRLEARGLATRQLDLNDRRVRLAMLTPRGQKVWALLSEAMYRAPEELRALTAEDLRTLWNATDKLPH